MFPDLPGQSGYNKRLNAAGPVVARLLTALAAQVPTWHQRLRLIDSTPLLCAASRQTVRRSELAGHAGYGYCRSHSRWFWGFRLYLVTTVEGMPITWCLAHPRIGEREVMAALLARDHHLVAAGQVILADAGHIACGPDQCPAPRTPHSWPGRPAAVTLIRRMMR